MFKTATAAICVVAVAAEGATVQRGAAAVDIAASVDPRVTAYHTSLTERRPMPGVLVVPASFNEGVDVQTDVDMENSLDIKVRNTKNIKLPFNIEIQEDIFPDVRQKKRHDVVVF